MKEGKQLVLNDSLNYVALVLRNHPDVSVDRMREISDQISEIDDGETLRLRILELAGVAPTQKVA